MIRPFLLLLSAIFFSLQGFSQNLGIGVTPPHPSAQLEIASPSGGLLPPRVALRSQNDNITIPNPAAGLLVYNTATAGNPPSNVVPGYYYNTGSAWIRLGGPGQQPGDMQYWNGHQWVLLPAGSNGQELSFCNGQLVWGPCPNSSGLATVLIDSIRNIRGSSANVHINIPLSGGTTLKQQGICYSLLPNPVPAQGDSTASLTPGTGTAVVPLGFLQDETTYHVRAYAINGLDTAYSADSTFTTTAVTLPSLNTLPPFGVSATSAWSGAVINSDGGANLNIKGINYDTSPVIDINDPGIYDVQPTIGVFYAQMTGLQPNTTYYVRAFASNGLTNTRNGSVLSFTTLPAGNMAAVYFCDSVRTTTGTTDPGPVPAISGLTFGQLKVVGAGAPTFQSRLDSVFSFTGWTVGATNGSDIFPAHTDTLTRYFEFSVVPSPGRSLQLTQLKFRLQRSGNGIRRVFVRSSVDGYNANLPASVSPANASLSVIAGTKVQVNDNSTAAQEGSSFTFSGPQYNNITGPVTFRIYGMFSEEASGTFGIDNVVLNGIVN